GALRRCPEFRADLLLRRCRLRRAPMRRSPPRLRTRRSALWVLPSGAACPCTSPPSYQERTGAVHSSRRARSLPGLFLDRSARKKRPAGGYRRVASWRTGSAPDRGIRDGDLLVLLVLLVGEGLVGRGFGLLVPVLGEWDETGGATRGVVPVQVDDAFTLGHDRGDQGLAGDVHGGTTHVEDRVHGQEQSHTLQGKAQGGQGQGQHHDRAGGPCGGGRA